MAQPRKLPQRAKPGQISPAPRRAVQVKMLVVNGRSPTRGGWKSTLVTLLLLLAMGAVVAEGGWVAVQLIVNPGSVSWLGWLLPESDRAPLSHYQTLREVQAEATKIGLTAEDVQIAVGKNERLMAIASARCTSPDATPCQQIVELRVYRRLPMLQPSSGDRYLELIDRLAINGPREIAALAPLLSQPGTSPGTNHPLPLTTVAGMSGAPAPGIWLDLSGEWQQGSDRLAYGQIVHYDPKQHRLSASVQWTSPNHVYPTWQQVTGSTAPELLVDQTVGLEPDFQVYQVRSTAAIDLKPISLSDAVLKSWTYRNGLTLAQHGLWTSALRLMQAARNGEWSAAAQAQLDVIALHAGVTKAQADRTWSNPSQGIAANLIDGRWTKALQLLQAALTDGYEVKDLLTADINRLWDQVGAALSVNPQQPDVQAWGSLILFAQKGRSTAIAWLQQHNPTVARADAMGETHAQAIDSRLQQVLSLMNKTLLVADHPSRIVGTVAPIGNPNLSDWLLPRGTLVKDEGQAWYRIQVNSFYDGSQWQRSPFELNLAAIGRAQQLWSLLGLATDPQIQLIVWDASGQPQTLQATIKATQIRGGIVQLLASGDAPHGVSFAPSANQSPPLAMTTATIHWSEAQTLSISVLNQQNPRLTAALLPVLWQSQSVSIRPVGNEEMLQTLGAWSVREVDLTGNSQPEAIVSIPAASTPASRSRSLIFSDQGTLIYSEIGREAGESLTAIAESDDSSPALLVEDGQTYRLKRWVSQRRGFE